MKLAAINPVMEFTKNDTCIIVDVLNKDLTNKKLTILFDSKDGFDGQACRSNKYQYVMAKGLNIIRADDTALAFKCTVFDMASNSVILETLPEKVQRYDCN